jgi:hypothetical protein
LPDGESEIFLIFGLDTISDNPKRFARRVVLSHPGREIALAREATQFAEPKASRLPPYSAPIANKARISDR